MEKLISRINPKKYIILVFYNRFNTFNKYSNRIIQIDTLKSLSAFMIIIYHFSDSGFFNYSFEENAMYVPGIGKILLGLCCVSVPLFFLINGILTLNKNYSFKTITYKVLSLIKVYFIWAAIFFWIYHWKELNLNNIFIPFYNDVGWLWFLKTLAFLYVFNYIFNHIPNKELWAKIFIFALLIFPFGTNLIWVFVIFFHPNIPLPSWGLTGFFTLYSIVYYLAPIYFFRNLYWVWNVLLIIVGLSLNTFEVFVYSNTFHNLQDNVNAFFPTIGTLLMTFGIFNIFRNINNHSNNFANFIRWIGRNTLGIYILHLPFISLLKAFANIEFSFFNGIIICFIILILSAISSSIIKSIPILKWSLSI